MFDLWYDGPCNASSNCDIARYVTVPGSHAQVCVFESSPRKPKTQRRRCHRSIVGNSMQASRVLALGQNHECHATNIIASSPKDHRFPFLFMLGGSLRPLMPEVREPWSELEPEVEELTALPEAVLGAWLTFSSIFVLITPNPGVTHPPHEQRKPVQANLPMLELHFLFGQVKRPSIFPSAKTSFIQDNGCRKICAH